MVVGLGAADLVDICDEIGKIFLVEIDEGVFLEQSLFTALGAGPIIADDVEDQRVVKLTRLFEMVDHAADLLVAVGHLCGIGFHQP